VIARPARLRPARPPIARGAPRGPVGAPGAVLAELAALFARGALRALRTREQKALALRAENEPSCVRAESARRTARDGRGGAST